MPEPFWKTLSLAEMSTSQWESLCDGCGKCCVVLLEDEDDGSVWETDVACKLYDCDKRRCTDYANRHSIVPDCVRLTPENAGTLAWMPNSCAYRRLALGQDLPDWHPLITGDPASTARSGNAARKTLMNEDDLGDEDLSDRVTIERRPAVR